MIFSLFTRPILIAAAVIPAIVLLVKVYRADTVEKEPGILIGKLIIFGIISTVCALITERIGEFIMDFLFSPGKFYNFLLYFIVVAVSEEGFKYLFLKRVTWNHPAYNFQFDGLVYAITISLGFALWENISYVISYGFSTAILRAVTAIPGHACFGVFMGVWYGKAKSAEKHGRLADCNLYSKLSLIIPVLLHGTYDYVASLTSANSTWYFIVFIIILFLLSFFNIRKQSDTDHPL